MRSNLNSKASRGNSYLSFFFGLFVFSQLFLNSANDSLVVGIFSGWILVTAFYAIAYDLKVKKSFLFLATIVIIYVLYGYGNGGWLVDTRHNLSFILFLIIFYDLFKRSNIQKLIKVVFIVNVVLFLIYIYLGLGFSISLFDQGDVPAYREYRTAGPPLYTFYIMPFLYLIFQKKNNSILLINGILGTIAILINGSGQSFAILTFLYGITYMRFQNNYEVFRNIAGIIIIAITIGFYLSNSADPRLQNKLSNILSPLESSTVQTRLLDLNYVWNQPRGVTEYIIGHGVGKRSTVYRANYEYPSLSSSRTFLEIDNGFYYIFNRFGLVGLIILLYSHWILYKRLEGLKPKLAFLAFFLGVNLLSIHYWTYYQGALIIGIVLASHNLTIKSNN